MWFIGVEVEQETSAPPPKKNPGSAPEISLSLTSSLARPPFNQHRLLGEKRDDTWIYEDT